MKTDLTIRGTLVLPDRLLPGGWLAVTDGRIAAIGSGEAPEAAESFDAGEDLVLPGVIDGQTHATSYGGLPGIRSTTRSAVAGGVTTIVDMPYDTPLPLTDVARLRAKTAAIAEHAHCDVALYATIMPGQPLDQIAPLIEGGVVAFKISSFESSPTRFPRIPTADMLALMQRLAGTDLPLGLHNEDQEIVLATIARLRAEGRDGIEAHSASRPPAAEMAATAQFLELGAATGAHVHPVHLSTGRGFDLVGQYRDAGYRATGELCVHYLWFDPEEDGDELGPLMKVNPPIRPGERQALWDALEAGLVAFVSSDHSSWPVDNKHTPSIFEAGAGVPGLETLLPAFHTVAARQGDAPALLTARMLSEEPARFFGLWPRKGALAVGADADIAVYSLGDQVWSAAAAHDELNWSPFDGRSFDGRVARTWVRGRLAWDGRAIVNRPGDGAYITRGDSRWFTTSS
jgi:allantoinase